MSDDKANSEDASSLETRTNLDYKDGISVSASASAPLLAGREPFRQERLQKQSVSNQMQSEGPLKSEIKTPFQANLTQLPNNNKLSLDVFDGRNFAGQVNVQLKPPSVSFTYRSVHLLEECRVRGLTPQHENEYVLCTPPGLPEYGLAFLEWLLPQLVLLDPKKRFSNLLGDTLTRFQQACSTDPSVDNDAKNDDAKGAEDMVKHKEEDTGQLEETA